MPAPPTIPEALATLSPDVVQALVPPSPHLPLAERREVIRGQLEVLFAALVEEGPGVGRVEDLHADGVPVRVYHPAGTSDRPRAAYVFVHGGGWWQGWVGSSVVDATCRERCAGAEVVVVSVGYRKAPEHPFPAGLDDVVTVVRWVHEQAGTLGVDPVRLGLGGQSAGANLAAAAALRLRDEDGPRLAMQLLEVPALDLTWGQEAARATPANELAGLEECVELYLDDMTLRTHPHVSPLLANDLAGLPPTHVVTGGLDPLRDDGLAYAARLREAQVATTASHFPEHMHGTPLLTRLLPQARDWRADVVGATRRLLG